MSSIISFFEYSFVCDSIDYGLSGDFGMKDKFFVTGVAEVEGVLFEAIVLDEVDKYKEMVLLY